MADPITLLGAVAAGSQLAELAAKALLKTIRVVKDLDDVPKKMGYLLQDVEKSTTRVHGIFSVVLQPGSKVFEKLDAAQSTSLADIATELHQAMDDVCTVLRPLVGPGPPGKGKAIQRFWKSVMALKAEEDVIEKLERIGRLNNEVSRQLDITSLELQATITDKLDMATTDSRNLQTTIRDGHTTIINELTNVGSTSRDVQQTITEVRGDVTAINVGMSRAVEETVFIRRQQETITDKLDTAATDSRNCQMTIRDEHAAMTSQLENITSISRDAQQTAIESRGELSAIKTGMSHVAEDTTAMRHQLSTLSNRRGPDTISYQQMQHLASQHRHENRADLQQLKEEILSALTGQISRLSIEAQKTSQSLGEADQMAVQQQTRIQLLSYPRSLAEAGAGLRSGGPFMPQRCRCRITRNVSTTKVGPLSFRAEVSNGHRPGCIHSKKGPRSWSYSTRAVLTPFLNATLELAIGATAGPGFWSIAPPLRFYGTVRRSQSPLFQAFDRLPSLCVKRVHMDEELDNLLSLRKGNFKQVLPGVDLGVEPYHMWLQVEWDVRVLKYRLKDLCNRIRFEIEHGHASGTDSDEHGRTLLFAFVDLLFLFHKQDCWRLLSAEFQSLFHIILDAGVDPGAKPSLSDGLQISGFSKIFIEEFRDDNVTAWDRLVLGLYQLDSETCNPISFIMGHVAAHVSPSVVVINPRRYLFQRPLQIFQLYPDIADGLGVFDDLEMAVLRRSLSELERLTAVHDPREHRPSFQSYSLTHLALGWGRGLRYLVDAHCPVYDAIESACRRRNLESLSILIDTPTAIFSYANNALQNEPYLGKLDDHMFDVLIAELTRRRERLKHLAKSHLPPHQQRELELDKEGMLDVTAEDTFHCLEQVIDIPESLDCWVSPYHAIANTWMLPKSWLDKIYNIGFKAVDIPNNDGSTPLLRYWDHWMTPLLRYWDHWKIKHIFERTTWFLSHGARPEWSHIADPNGTRYPTILFYVGVLLKRCMGISIVCSEAFEGCRESSTWVQASLHLVTDGCVCLCGADGCLASHLLWRCSPGGCFCSVGTVGQRHHALKNWISAWQISNTEKEHVYSEVARLELFERLGMAHTCCCNGSSYVGIYDISYYARLCPDEEERARLQDEDAELALQLQDLIAQYQDARAMHNGSIESFWRLWWMVLDEILPPLLSAEACKSHLLRGWERAENSEYRKLSRSTMEIRSAREKEALAKAGYIGPEFEDFRQVIRAHFSGRDWNPLTSGDSSDDDDDYGDDDDDGDSAWACSDEE